MTDLMTGTVDFVQRRECSAVKQALAAVTALHDAVALKKEIRLPVLPETRQAVFELEDEIRTLKTELLRSPHPEQLMLPGMPNDPLAWCEDSAQPNTQCTEGGWNEIPSRSPWRLAD